MADGTGAWDVFGSEVQQAIAEAASSLSALGEVLQSAIAGNAGGANVELQFESSMVAAGIAITFSGGVVFQISWPQVTGSGGTTASRAGNR